MKTVNNSVEQAKESINFDHSTANHNINNSDFNFIAPYYDFIQSLIFGKRLLKAQSYFLSEINKNDEVLIMGGGSGKILDSLSAYCIPKKVVYVEQSFKMVARAKALKYAGDIDFVCENVLEWKPIKKFNVVLLPFILDCFSTEGLLHLLQKLNSNIAEGGHIIFTDFVYVKQRRGALQMLVPIMYFFFKLTAKLQVSKLPNYNLSFEEAGFELVKKENFVKRMVESRVFRKKP